MAIALVFDALSDPLLGSLSDSTRSRLGRRHPYLFAGPLPLALCFYLLFVPPSDLSDPALFGWLTLFAVLTRTCLTLFAVPYMSLGAEFSKDYVGRTWIVATRMSFGAIGFIGAAAIAFFGFFRPTPEFPIGHLDPEPYAPFAFTLAALIAIAQLGSAASTLAPARALPAPDDAEPFSAARVFAEIRGALSQDSFRWFGIAGIIAAGGLGIRQTLALHVNTFYWELTSEQTGVVMVATLLGLLVGFPLWAVASRRMEKRLVFQAGLWLLGVSVFAPPALRSVGLFPENGDLSMLVPAVTAFALLSAVGGTGMQLAQHSMAADIADEYALATGRRQEGVFFGSVNVLVKCSSGLGHQLAGLLLDLIELHPDSQPGQTAPGVVSRLGWSYGVSVLVVALAAAWAIRRYDLGRDRVAEIQAGLAERGID